MSDNVVPFPKSNLSDIPAMLRHLAQAIENGEHNEVEVCLVVLPREGEWPKVFGFGPEGVLTSDAALVGHMELAKAFFVQNTTERT